MLFFFTQLLDRQFEKLQTLPLGTQRPDFLQLSTGPTSSPLGKQVMPWILRGAGIVSTLIRWETSQIDPSGLLAFLLSVLTLCLFCPIFWETSFTFFPYFFFLNRKPLLFYGYNTILIFFLRLQMIIINFLFPISSLFLWRQFFPLSWFSYLCV